LKDHLSGALPLLNRKTLELGRSLATQPDLILLDEIAGGLTEKEVRQVLEIVRRVREMGVTIAWIEHILMMMSEGVDRLLIIAEGKELQCGDPANIMNSHEVIECYLGVEDE
jgi:branched-chain amino acid transport system ATP-binding protein